MLRGPAARPTRPAAGRALGGRPAALALAALLTAAACASRGPSFRRAGQTRAALELGAKVPGPASPLLELLARELALHFAELSADDEADAPIYFMSYDVIDVDELWLACSDGAKTRHARDRSRVVDVDVRVGGPELDNSRSETGDYFGRGLGLGMDAPLEDDPLALAQILWLATDAQYRAARDAYSEVSTAESMLARDDEHPDFSRQAPLVHVEAPAVAALDELAARFEPLLCDLSLALAADPAVLESQVVLAGQAETHHYVDSEGSVVQAGRTRLRLMLSVTGQADDGMVLERFASFEAHQPEQLPPAELVEATASRLRAELVALRAAPVAEPYTGPAVLEGRAAAVFFHEIFGHRLEGHRQKNLLEGQTFANMLEQRVLPAFIDVVDDPTVAVLDGTPLNGHYLVDEEAVAARPVALVVEGRLREFLLSRSTVVPFEASNGHGRRSRGHPVVARQGNLIVQSRRALSMPALRRALIDEVKRQNKPYGLWFVDIQGGYTITDRSGPQAFKVMPLLVYRVYPDGRPDELVRGADIVGTPLAAFETLMATGDKLEVFNGMCGAESGWVPVSAVSPALLLSKLEIERSLNERNRPPLLPPPPKALDRPSAPPPAITPTRARPAGFAPPARSARP